MTTGTRQENSATSILELAQQRANEKIETVILGVITNLQKAHVSNSHNSNCQCAFCETLKKYVATKRAFKRVKKEVEKLNSILDGFPTLSGSISNIKRKGSLSDVLDLQEKTKKLRKEINFLKEKVL